MGCDIHTYREKLVNEVWATADLWSTYDYGDGGKGIEVEFGDRAYSDRNYDLFGLLAGVRREFNFSLKRRGLPFDVSPEVQAESDKWNGDGHSHSYLYLHELKSLRQWISGKTLPIQGMKDLDGLKALKASIDSGAPNWDLLYPYCASTTRPNSVEFSIDVPISFICGDALDRIIASFDGIDGDNHRLVFWFDN